MGEVRMCVCVRERERERERERKRERGSEAWNLHFKFWNEKLSFLFCAN